MPELALQNQIAKRKAALLLKKESLDLMADRCAEQLQRLPRGTLRLANPHIYKVAISSKLLNLRNNLIKQYLDKLD